MPTIQHVKSDLEDTRPRNKESKTQNDRRKFINICVSSKNIGGVFRSEMPNKRVYYNDEEMKTGEVKFRSTELGTQKDGFENYFMELS
jgi:hypothetical protein